ncbi:ATP synthase subunit g, mitochondrial-like [Dreissena polymorpha]|uniref:Uncharacterized protein n=1 Tax=Dreissena polymorpha TaxID=45954 RepID=A0A9D4E9Q6_DREPO|nr:ATP synthase subunit g, mitochondrial-like [Dreissena polymorpha]KAH3774944.1 hypothetical protein DPMN_176338 [Dreissena polymorpha]
MVVKVVRYLGVLGQRSFYYIQTNMPVARRYVMAEMMPPSPGEFGQYVKELGQAVGKASSLSVKNMTFYEALITSCVATEVAMWFFIGEMIGKRSLIGYQVPHTLAEH